jgi:type I restriction enzyme, S subunit
VSELPAAWAEARLATIARVEMGQSPPSSTYNQRGEGFPFFQGKAEFGPLYPTARKWCTAPSKLANEGDILLSVRAPVGPTNLAPARSCIGRGLAAIRALPEVHQKYLLHYFRHLEPWLSQQGTGTTFKAVSGDFVRRLRVCIAPAHEQARIADKLDAVLGRVNSCRERLDRVPRILKKFREAVLEAAVSGRLTAEWRLKSESISSWEIALKEAPPVLPNGYKRLSKRPFSVVPVEHEPGSLPETWAIRTIGALYEERVIVDFADGNHGSQYPRAEDFGSKGVIFLTAQQISDDHRVDLQACPLLKESKARKLVKGWASEGDVLLTHNATVGRVALLQDTSDKVLLGTSVTFYRTHGEYLDGRYLKWMFCSPYFQKQLHSVMEQTTRDQVPITTQVSLNVLCPPIQEQREIARRVDALFGLADSQRRQHKAAVSTVLKLAPAILSKAFRGEFVPQDPNDEPASELLRRIQTLRETQVTARKRARKNSRTGSADFDQATPHAEERSAHSLAAILTKRGPLRPEELLQASGLDIDTFYDQLKEEVTASRIRERRKGKGTGGRWLEIAR